MLAIREADVAHHHEQTGGILRRIVPPLFLQRLLWHDTQLQCHTVARRLEQDGIVIDHLELHVVRLAFLGLSRNDESLQFLSVRHLDSRIGQEHHFALICVLVFRERLLLLQVIFLRNLLFRVLIVLIQFHILLRCFLLLHRLFLESFVGLLQERHMVVERFEVNRSVDVQIAIVRDCIAQRTSILQLCAAQP